MADKEREVCPGSGAEGKWQSRMCRWCGREFEHARPSDWSDKHQISHYRMPRHYRPENQA